MVQTLRVKPEVLQVMTAQLQALVKGILLVHYLKIHVRYIEKSG